MNNFKIEQLKNYYEEQVKKIKHDSVVNWIEAINERYEIAINKSLVYI